MTISQRQFTLLNEMGISLWQRRDLPKTITIKASSAEKQIIEQQVVTAPVKSASLPKMKLKAIDLNKLNKQQIFADILLSLNLLPRDINVNNEQLLLKQLTWQFTDTDNIDLSKNTLTTPSLNNIARSAKLKRQLWQTIQEHLIEKHSLQKHSLPEQNSQEENQ